MKADHDTGCKASEKDEYLFLSPKRMFSSAVPLSFIIDAVRYCWTREFPVVFVGKHRTSFVVLVKDAYNSHNSFSLTAKLSIIRGLGMSPTSRFRKSGRRPGLAEQSICIYRCPACEFVMTIAVV